MNFYSSEELYSVKFDVTVLQQPHTNKETKYYIKNVGINET